MNYDDGSHIIDIWRHHSGGVINATPMLPLQVSLWSARRLAYGVLPVLSAMEQSGVDSAPYLRRADIDEFGLYDPSYTIGIEQELRLLKDAFAAVGTPGFGIQLASFYSLRSFSTLGLAMQASQDAAAVLQLVAQFPQLAWGVSDVTVTFSANEVALHFEPHPLLGELSMGLVERDMLCALNILAECSGQRFEPSCVQLVRARPVAALHNDYEQGFGRAPQWGRPCHQMSFPLGRFLQPLPQADERMQRFYQAQCQHMVEIIRRPFSISQNVTERLRRSRPIPDLPALAQQLWLSPRTLQRRLQAEHTCFSDLVRKVRMERATARLQDPQTTLAALAAELGFSDEVAFSHAFQSWTGASPRAWQRRREKDSTA